MPWRGGFDGPMCRKPDLCRLEGGCYFVAMFEAYLDEHGGRWGDGNPQTRWILEPRLVDIGPAPLRIVWHPGYDGFGWAL